MRPICTRHGSRSRRRGIVIGASCQLSNGHRLGSSRSAARKRVTSVLNLHRPLPEPWVAAGSGLSYQCGWISTRATSRVGRRRRSAVAAARLAAARQQDRLAAGQLLLPWVFPSAQWARRCQHHASAGAGTRNPARGNVLKPRSRRMGSEAIRKASHGTVDGLTVQRRGQPL